jgi:hypothetical protein
MDEDNKDLFRTAVGVFAHYIGIELENEKDLLWIAEEAFEKLPDCWEFGVADEGENEGIPYFFNTITEQSVWNHPLEAQYRAKLKRERRIKQENLEKEENSKPIKFPFSKKVDDKEERPEDPVFSFDLEDLDDDADKYEKSPIGRNISQQASVNSKHDNKSQSVRFGLQEEDFLDNQDNNEKERRNLNSNTQMKIGNNNNNNHNNNNNNKNKNNNYSHPSINNNGNSNGPEKREVLHDGNNKGILGGDPWFTPREMRHHASDIDERDHHNHDNNDHLADHDNYDNHVEDDHRNSNSNSNSNNNSNSDHRRDHPSNVANPNNDWRDNSREDRRVSGPGRSRVNTRERGRTNSYGNNNNGRRENDRRELSRESRNNNNNTNNNNNRTAGSRSPLSSTDRDASYNLPDTSSTIIVNALDTSKEAYDKLFDTYQHQIRMNEHLKQDNDRLLTELSLTKQRHLHECQSLQEEIKIFESKLQQEKLTNQQLEHQKLRIEHELQQKRQEINDIHDLQVKEEINKIRFEIEENALKKMKLQEKKFSEEQEVLHNEILVWKRKVDEITYELENTQRKLLFNKENIRSEFQQEIKSFQDKIMKLESQEKSYLLDLQKKQQEVVDLQQQKALQFQEFQQQLQAFELLKQQHVKVQQDQQIQQELSIANHQRLLQVEQENVSMKTELHLLRKEKTSDSFEKQKLQFLQGNKEEQLHLFEQELKTAKQQLLQEQRKFKQYQQQNEIKQRMTNDHYDNQILSLQEQEQKYKQDVDSTNLHLQSLQEKLIFFQAKEEELRQRLLQQEKEIFSLRDDLFQKEKSLSQRKQEEEMFQSNLQQVRSSYEQQLQEKVTAHVNEANQWNQERLRLIGEKQTIEQEVASKVPLLISKITNEMEIDFQEQFTKRIAELKREYESSVQKKQQEILEMQSNFQDRQQKEKMKYMEDKLEYERSKQENKNLLQQLDEKDDLIRELKKQIRHFESRSNSDRDMNHHSLSLFNDELEQYNSPYTNNNKQSSKSMRMSRTIMARKPAQELHLDMIEQQSHAQPRSQYQDVNHDFHASYEEGIENKSAAVSNQQQQSELFRSLNDSQLHRPAVHPMTNSIKDEIDQNAMSYLNEQLSLMKQQISQVLNTKPRQELEDSVTHKTVTFAVEEALGEKYSPSQEAPSYAPRSSNVSLSKVLHSTEDSFTDRSASIDSKPSRYLDMPRKLHAATTPSSILQTSANNDRHSMWSQLLVESVSNTSTSSLLSNNNTQDFSFIQDGGYHPGYWKTKYTR